MRLQRTHAKVNDYPSVFGEPSCHFCPQISSVLKSPSLHPSSPSAHPESRASLHGGWVSKVLNKSVLNTSFFFFLGFIFKKSLHSRWGSNPQPRDQESHTPLTEPDRHPLKHLLKFYFYSLFPFFCSPSHWHGEFLHSRAFSSQASLSPRHPFLRHSFLYS